MEKRPAPRVEKRTISLPAEQERDVAVERWLRDQVVPVYDAMQIDPGRGRSAEQIASRLRAHHASAAKKGARGA